MVAFAASRSVVYGVVGKVSVVRSIFAIICVALASLACDRTDIKTPSPVVGGVVDVSAGMPGATVDLTGAWSVRWSVLDESIPPAQWTESARFHVPGTIPRDHRPPGWANGTGVATFGVTMTGLDPHEDYAIYIPKMWPTRLGCTTAEGARVFAGRNGELPVSREPRLASYALAIPRTRWVSCTLTFHVPASEVGTVAGFWDTPRFGAARNILNLIDLERAKFGAFPAFLMTFALFFAAEWALRRREVEPLLYAGAVSSLGLWVGCFGGAFDATPLVDWIAPRRIEFAGLALAPPVFLTLIRRILRRRSNGMYVALLATGILAAVAAFVVPRTLVHGVLLVAQVGASLSSLVVLGLAGVTLTRRNTALDDRLVSLGASGPALAGIGEIVLVRLGFGAPGLTVLGVGALAFLVSLVLARRNASARAAAEAYSQATRRFVPVEFLHALGHQDVTTARLGDARVQRLTILFADVRNFTALSESLSPEQTFAFLNRLLSRLAPLVRQHGGFVDKYIGDAVMALFPGRPEDAVRAADAMQIEVARSGDLGTGSIRLGLGIGVHAGDVMLGTIGEAERFEATVISDAVNLTARLESLTKQLGCRTLLTSDIVLELPEKMRQLIRPLGRFAVKGKQQSVELFESFAADPDSTRAHKAGSAAEWTAMLEAFERGDFETAIDIVAPLRDRCPDDGPANWWFLRLLAAMHDTEGAAMSSGGVLKLDEK